MTETPEMFRNCPFCGASHRSLYVDELEEMVLRCRETAERYKLGLLADYSEHEISPTKCETEMLSNQARFDRAIQEQAA